MHQFAFYYSDLKNKESVITVSDTGLIIRLTKVVRLKVGDTAILFSRLYHARVKLVAFTHKVMTFDVITIEKNKILTPNITLLLPLLKKESLETAVYGAVEMGVNLIQLVITEKVQRKWGTKELERLNRIVIAAAEQSKCYHFAQLLEPISLETALLNYSNTQLLFADPEGEKLGVIERDCTLLVGPEGDLTSQEKLLLQENKCKFFRLTPTVLRACQAAVLSVGLIRTGS